MNIVIATIKSWNIKNATTFASSYADKCTTHLITSKDQLTFGYLQNINPSYIFFPHWSWIIPDAIFEKFNCVVFHMTDLPFGRGGSPLQNLISRKIYKTKLSAIKVCKEVDAGDVYLKTEVDIAAGSAQEIFTKISQIIFFEMLPQFILSSLIPVKQKGEVVHFERRKPEQSDIAKAALVSMIDFYDFIRMLDGEGYPLAYVELHGRKIIFKAVHMQDGKLSGEFEIT